jgi:SAM-dependent methyltransferase
VAWYREWFGEEYLDLYAHRDRQEAERQADFVERRLGPEKPHAVLDLACGAGRHTDALRRRGYRVLGVDLSVTLLARRPDLPRVAGDMRALPFAASSFDWVLNFFTSFGYFEEERENFRVLEEVVRMLAPGGRFLIDLMNAEPVIENLQPRESFTRNGRQVSRPPGQARQQAHPDRPPRRHRADVPRERSRLPAGGGRDRNAVGRPPGGRDVRKLLRRPLHP